MAACLHGGSTRLPSLPLRACRVQPLATPVVPAIITLALLSCARAWNPHLCIPWPASERQHAVESHMPGQLARDTPRAAAHRGRRWCVQPHNDHLNLAHIEPSGHQAGANALLRGLFGRKRPLPPFPGTRAACAYCRPSQPGGQWGASQHLLPPQTQTQHSATACSCRTPNSLSTCGHARGLSSQQLCTMHVCMALYSTNIGMWLQQKYGTPCAGQDVSVPAHSWQSLCGEHVLK